MLKQLKIKNIALISECNIEFKNGFNSLSGETGAGKSIIIDSLAFVLGARADKTLIKSGETQAEVTAVFSSDEESVQNILHDMDIEKDNTIRITRLMQSGNNECKVNGEIVTLGYLKKLTNALVDVFGQHDSVELLDENNHINYVDMLSNDILNKKTELKESLDELKSINETIHSLGGNGEERERNIEILKYEINEITSSNLYANEEDELLVKKSKLENAEKINSALYDTIQCLDGDYSAITQVKHSSVLLDQISKYDENYSKYVSRLQSTKYELDDILSCVKSELNGNDYSDKEMDSVIDRIDLIHELERKYGKTIDEVLSYLDKANEKLQKLENAVGELAKLATQKDAILERVLKSAQDLTNARKLACVDFEKAIVTQLNQLGMKNASFKVNITSDYIFNNVEQVVGYNGGDKVVFLFSANLGEEMLPLNKIISGGELSRFMLAFKCVLNNHTSKTYVFDEIDTGIGGATANVVAKKIADIASSNQVLCVTHLAQIAAMADTNFLIEKYESSNKTYTKVTRLDEEQKVNEITRMIGVTENDDFAKMHAKELIKESNNYKNRI